MTARPAGTAGYETVAAALLSMRLGFEEVHRHVLHLIPDENCLALHEVSRLVGEWRDRPLSRTQAMNAALLPARSAQAMLVASALSMGFAPTIIQHNRAIAVRILRLRAPRLATAPR